MTFSPFTIIGDDRPGQIVCVCDHATNAVPPCIGSSLGLPEADMSRHIAYDVGAAGVTTALAERLNGPAIQSNFSRLVIDPNRGEDDPTLLMRLYDGSVIPANRDAGATEKHRRLEAFYRPYHAAVERLLATRDAPVLISIHSFTPKLNGRSLRPWQIGILYSEDKRLAEPLLSLLKNAADLCVGDNEPYSGHLPGDTMDRHALRHGRPHVLIELRNDLILSAESQIAWADRLAPMIADAVALARL